MRTKTLLLTAAIGAAGIATSMAQVFSVNAVGYVTKTIPKNGFALIANPLNNTASNKINDLFKGLPFGTQIFRYNGTGFDTAAYDDIDNKYLPDSVGNADLLPGEGVFIKNNTANDVSVTFVGEVMQGDLKNPLPKGLSIKSSQVPQAGTPEDLGMKGVPGDQIFQFDASKQSYNASAFDDIDNKFVPSITIDVGEAVFLSKTAAGSWDRNFNVNQ